MNRTKTIAAGICLSVLALAPAFAASDVPASDMKDTPQAMDYFHAHSFDFPQNFRFAHPGPEWFIQHASDFNFTDKQSEEMKKMAKEMVDDTKKYDVESIKAHEKYEKDGNEKTVSESQLKSDIDKIGKAEVNLAFTMIPYHLKSYALLTSAQKKTFDDLIAKGDGKK